MRKLLFYLFAFISMNFSAQSQIKYHDIDPDTTVNSWDAFFVTLSEPPQTTGSYFFNLWWHPTPEVVIQSNLADSTEILFNSTNNNPAKLDLNDDINASAGNWTIANYHALSSGNAGNWTNDATDKYIAFRFKPGNSWLYGWLKMSVGSGASSFTVYEWAYDTTGNSIKAGQVTPTTHIANTTPLKRLNIYPSPAKETIIIEGVNAGTINITDISGKSYEIDFIKSGDKHTANISSLPVQTYIIRTGNYIGQFVKQQ